MSLGQQQPLTYDQLLHYPNLKFFLFQEVWCLRRDQSKCVVFVGKLPTFCRTKMPFQNVVAIISVLFSVFASTTTAKCLFTNNQGPAKLARCVYPFTFNKVTYTTCTNAKDPEGKFWWETDLLMFLLKQLW